MVLGTIPSQATASVRVSVHNDGAIIQTFTDTADTTKVSESLTVGNNVFKSIASGQNVIYAIVGGNFGGVFQIRTSDGQVSVKKSLDFETKSFYTVIVRATVPSLPAQYAEKTYTVTIEDENDNSPVFAVADTTKTQEVFVDKFSPEGTVVTRVCVYITAYFIYLQYTEVKR